MPTTQSPEDEKRRALPATARVVRKSTIEDFLEKHRRARRVKPKPKGMFLRSRKRARSRGAAS